MNLAICQLYEPGLARIGLANRIRAAAAATGRVINAAINLAMCQFVWLSPPLTRSLSRTLALSLSLSLPT